jgi:lipoprotein-releasing system permease protein
MSKNSFSRFIASRLQFAGEGNFSATAIKVARVSVALATTILLVSVLIYAGYQKEIQKRMFSVSGQFTIRQFTTGTLYEEQAQLKNDPLVLALRKLPFISHIQTFALKPALLSSEGEVSGIILKGIGSDFNSKAFESNLVSKPVHPLPQKEEIWLSQKIARQMLLKKGSEVILFFMQEPPRYRKVKIAGIYQTGLEQMDENLVFCSQSLVQEMNEWTNEQVGGFEVFVSDFSLLDRIIDLVIQKLPYHLGIEPITQTQAQMFEWLDVIGRNVLIMFILVSIVAGFNMAATLLILVMERRKMIGVIKTLGAENQTIQKIFILNGLQTLGKGMLWGNLLAFFLCGLQYQFHLIPLNPENYYLSSVPISWSWSGFFGINLGIFFLAWFALLFPVRMVNKIQPAEAVRAV